jgi:hypothetical protein
MEITPAVAASPLFRGISPEELEPLLDCMGAACRRYRRGELILCRGELARRLGLVLSGAVHIVREDFWGNRTIVGLAESGEVIAESYACLGSEPLEVSALARQRRRCVSGAGGRVAGCGRGCAPTASCPGTCWHCWRAQLALTRKMATWPGAPPGTRCSASFPPRLSGRETGLRHPPGPPAAGGLLAVDRSALSAVLSRLRDEGVLEFHKNHFRLLRPEQLPE